MRKMKYELNTLTTLTGIIINIQLIMLIITMCNVLGTSHKKCVVNLTILITTDVIISKEIIKPTIRKDHKLITEDNKGVRIFKK